MAFVILACSDIRGEKVNIELPFSESPATISSLITILETVFRGEEENIAAESGDTSYPRPPSEPITINRVQRYSDDSQNWAELSSVSQLQSYDQLYVFRKNATKSDISTQRELPQSRPSKFFNPNGNMSRGGSLPRSNANHSYSGNTNEPPHSVEPQRNQYGGGGNGNTSGYAQNNYGSGPLTTTGGINSSNADYSSSAPQTQSDMSPAQQIQYLFTAGDQNRRGYLTLRDFQSIFRACAIQFPPEVTEDIHRVYARERRGEPAMSFENFQTYGRDYPTAITIAYTRLSSEQREQALAKQKRDAAAAAEELQKQQQQLEERLKAVQNDLKKENDKRARIQNEMEEIRTARDPSAYEQEQRLLDKEVTVQTCRRRLAHEEDDFEKMAAERRQKTVSPGNTRMDNSYHNLH